MSEDDRACCSPAREPAEAAANTAETHSDTEDWRTEPATDSDERTDRMVRVDGGTFQMGTDEDVGDRKSVV